MMGKKERSFAQLIQVSLEELVPADHFYRRLERTLDLSFVGYDLGEPLPDHSSLTRIRERYGVEVFRRFFEQIVEQCQEAGLVWGIELYDDATKVKANASLESLTPRFAVEAHLTNVFMEETKEPPEETEQAASSQAAASSELLKQEATDVPIPLPVSLSPEAYEELSQKNAERHDWLEQLGAQNRSVTSRCYQRIADLRMSTTDPDATIMLHKDGSHLGYQTRLGRRWRQIAYHLERLSDSCRGDGKSTDARSRLSHSLLLEAVAQAGHR